MDSTQYNGNNMTMSGYDDFFYDRQHDDGDWSTQKCAANTFQLAIRWYCTMAFGEQTKRERARERWRVSTCSNASCFRRQTFFNRLLSCRRCTRNAYNTQLQLIETAKRIQQQDIERWIDRANKKIRWCNGTLHDQFWVKVSVVAHCHCSLHDGDAY